ncbi:7484_t:CDS:2 [Racocetra fulgida]|uniref:7484_t:CDS:1 n=1 Tax=Racocetra fulgida TaxID=60492 RepID=A0A9N9GP29_9GLOM|nr:7484_t:CDS:2 [Racocetra fulgida]
MQSELDLLEEKATLTELKAKNAELMAKKAKLKTKNAEYIKLKDETAKLKTENTKLLKQIIEKYAKNKVDIVKLKNGLQYPILFECIKATILELEEKNAILRPIIEEFAKKSEYSHLVTAFDKKNRKFQAKCIQIAEKILDEEPIIEYRPPFLDGLEFDAFFQKYQIALEVQGRQHRFHNTSWYKDVKKLEDIVNPLTRKNDYWLTKLPNRKFKYLQHQTSDLSQDTRTGSSCPSVKEIKEWAPAQIVSFLESRNLYLTNSDIEMIKKNGIAGQDFLLLKENDLYRIGLPIGPARRIIQLIKKILGTSLMDRPSTNLVYVFIDNSNIWIEGKYTVENLEQLGGAPFLVGFRPPPNDSLWARIRDQGFEGL